MSLLSLNRKLKTSMMPFIWAFAAVFIIGIFASFTFNGVQTSDMPRVASLARVAGEEIPIEEFAAVLEQNLEQTRQFASFGGGVVTVRDLADAPARAYNQLLEERARAAAAEAEGVRVDYGEASRDLEKSVEERLATVAQGATPSERAAIRQSLLSRPQVEAHRRQLLAERLREKLSATARPVEVQAAHILIKIDGISEATARTRAETLARQAKAGADFAKLARENSQDEGSKVKGGVVGWVGALPAPQPTGKNAAPDPNAVGNFVPEFTAAALRLKKGEVSDPVRSNFGYHVIKIIDERDYRPPAEPPAPKTPKKPGDPPEKTPEQKRQEALDNYRNAAGSKIAEGVFAEWKARLESQVEPVSPWLKGYQLEQQANQFTMGSDGKPVDTNDLLSQAIAYYEEALKSNDPTSGRALAYKIVQLIHRRALQLEEAKKTAEAKAELARAVEMLKTWAPKASDAEMYFLQGEVLEKSADKTGALQAYQKSMEAAYGNADVLQRLEARFKTLGRKDLAGKATAKAAEATKRQQAQQAAQQAEMQRRIQEQIKQQMEDQAREKGGNAPAPEGR